jgi:transposase
MKIPKQESKIEFKELAVKRIKDCQSVSMVCKELGLSDQPKRNWVKAETEGRLSGSCSKVVHRKKWSPQDYARRTSSSSGSSKS